MSAEAPVNPPLVTRIPAPPRLLEAINWTPNNVLPLTSWTAVVRQPLATRIERRSDRAALGAQEGVRGSLLGTLLVVVSGTKPFLMSDWPVPRGAVPSIDLRTFLNSLEIQLIGQDKFFGLAGHPNFDWPIPRGAQHPVALRTYLNSLPPLLVVTFLAAWAKQEQLIGGGLYVP